MSTEAPPPYSLLAEITHRCPLHCPYCSNPLDLKRGKQELLAGEWRRVLEEAARLGIVQVGFSGGEPLVRPELEELVASAHDLGLYTNLITSGLGLTELRARSLAARGLNSVQLSVQGSDHLFADGLAGARAHQHKLEAARAVRAAGLPLSMNVVLHRFNIDQLGSIVDLCADWGAERLELANTQYHGWALVNREQLMPSREQIRHAELVFRAKRDRLGRRLELIWVIPDYYEGLPKPCMGGWARIAMTVSPDGLALPCASAASIRSLRFDSVRQCDLSWIWRQSPAFNAFRGEGWMTEPCRSCPRRALDHGGCRCQAFALTGDAGRTDPACRWSPDHHLVSGARRPAGEGSSDLSLLRYRRHGALDPGLGKESPPA
ncbi:MAG: pyrroloquinoline quinone biosynthesis protein PqqE [Candidatus Dormibacteraeota bacterium]|nr:pyrroloquinoline quinone biosynthesis protein PqqE [Candidatus Dormibacteraeota bacterium]